MSARRDLLTKSALLAGSACVVLLGVDIALGHWPSASNLAVGGLLLIAAAPGMWRASLVTPSFEVTSSAFVYRRAGRWPSRAVSRRFEREQVTGVYVSQRATWTSGWAYFITFTPIRRRWGVAIDARMLGDVPQPAEMRALLSAAGWPLLDKQRWQQEVTQWRQEVKRLRRPGRR